MNHFCNLQIYALVVSTEVYDMAFLMCKKIMLFDSQMWHANPTRGN